MNFGKLWIMLFDVLKYSMGKKGKSLDGKLSKKAINLGYFCSPIGMLCS